MTDKTNTPAPAHEAVLTDDEIIEVFAKTPVSKTPWGYEIQCVRALLSKLRAPVADERISDDTLWSWAEQIMGGKEAHHVGRDRVLRFARAALSSAPVAGEVQPAAYLTLDEEGSPSMLFFDVVEARTYCAPDEEPEPLFRHAAPQASEAVPSEPLRVFSAGMWTYDGTGQAFSHTELDEAAFVTYRAALSAQPGAQKGGSDAE